MFLKKLQVHQFRNYSETILETDAAVNILIGDNAQGKTNIVEAIYALALTKSHRTTNDRELIQWHQSFASIIGQIEKKYGTYDLQLLFAKQGKKAKINGLAQKKLSEYIGHLNVVMFAPEDLEIVKGSPSVRRRFIDIEIGQIQPTYLYHLAQYQRALEQKNNNLRQLQMDSSASREMISIWNEQLATYAVKMIKKRMYFLEKLQNWAQIIHHGITNQQETLNIQYQCSVPLETNADESVLISDYMVKLEQLQEKEIRRGSTLIGPHRDDLLFYINEKEVHTFGSQGQQRTVALSLKLAEIELIAEIVGEYPILLLDDVLSELDQTRQTMLLDTFQNKVQTFITTTSIANVDLEKIKEAAIFDVSAGRIARRVE